MALKDCMRKLGKALSKEQSDFVDWTDMKAKLGQYISDGMTDNEAVRALLTDVNNEIIDATKRAEAEGVTIAKKPSVLAEIKSFSEAQAKQARKQLTEIQAATKELDRVHQDINFVRDTVRRDFLDDGQGVIDLNDDSAVRQRLSAMFFKNPKLFTIGKLAGDLLKGKSPLQIYKSWQDMQKLQAETRDKMRGLLVQEAAAIEQLERVTGEKIPPGIYFQGKKGAITFDEMRRGVIMLTEKKDLSTFIHEAGHLYLEVFRSLAEDLGAPKQMQDDWKKILKFLEIKSGDEITTKHHELFADTFMRYTMEGKAPSIEMQDAFGEFRVWLLSLYKNVRRIMKMPLPEEITGVFDRMLASDEAIAEAETVQEYAALFTSPEQTGATVEAFALYKRGIMRAHNEGVDRETAKVFADMQRSEKAVWKDVLDTIRFDVQEEAYKMPVFRALAKLQKNTNPDGSPTVDIAFKLDKASVLAALRGDTESLKILRKQDLYRVEGGVDIDLAAPRFGFKTGRELVEALLNAPKMDEWIDAQANAIMNERFPDPALDGTLVERAIQTVHTERRAEIIAYEMRKLRELARKDKPIVSATKKALKREDKQALEANKAMLPKRAELAAIKEAAKEAVSRRQVRNVKPHEHLQGERKAGRLARLAFERKDYQVAYEQTLLQLKHFEMYRQSIAFKKQIESKHKYVSKFENAKTRTKVREKLGRSDLLAEIDAILESVDLRKMSLAKVDRKNAMQGLEDAINGRFDKDGKMIAPPTLIVSDETRANIMDKSVNWQNMKVSEFLEMVGVIKQLEKQALGEVEAIINGEKVKLEDAANAVIDSMLKNNKVIKTGHGEPRLTETLRKHKQRGISTWQRIGSIMRTLDADEWGEMNKRIAVVMRRAYSEKLIPWIHKMQHDVANLWMTNYTNEEMLRLKDRTILIQSSGETFSKLDIIGFSMYWGSEDGRTVIREALDEDGTAPFSEATINEMLAQMTAQDWNFVQDMWDYRDSYWPQIAEAARRRLGVAPEKVEAAPFTIRTADGQEVSLRGGYSPLRYDPRHSVKAQKVDADTIAKEVQGSYHIIGSIRASATFQRKKNHHQVPRLDLGMHETELREVIRDLAIGDEYNYLQKLLNRNDVAAAFKQTGNDEYLKTIKLWAKDAAVGELPSDGFIENMSQWTRTGFIASRLAFNLTVTALQFTGIFQSMAKIGTVHYLHGVGKLMEDPAGQWKEVMEKSSFMSTRYRLGAFDKDAQDSRAWLESFVGPVPTHLAKNVKTIAQYYYWPIMKAQQGVDVTTWLGAYHKAATTMNKGDAEAILYADSEVEAAQTSGMFTDRSGLERGTLGSKVRQVQFVRLWTALIGYMQAKGNIAYEKTHKTFEGGVIKNVKERPEQVAAWAGDMVLLFVVEGIASGLLYGRKPEDEDDDFWDAELLTWIGWQTLESIGSSVPFVRDVPGARFAGGTTPLGVFTHDIFALGEQIAQWEFDEQLTTEAMNVAGTAFHIPTTQTNRALRSLWRDLEGDEEIELYNYLIGPPRKEK